MLSIRTDHDRLKSTNRERPKAQGSFLCVPFRTLMREDLRAFVWIDRSNEM